MFRILLLFLISHFILPSSLAAASEADRAEIKRGCLAKLNWSEPACQCLAHKATEIEDVQQAFVAATLNQDSTATADLRRRMTIPQITQASMFVLKVGPGCQGGP